MMYIKTLHNHKLATQPLRDLLALAGPARTPEEIQILVSVVRSYKRMRGAFPTKQLRNNLDALYTQAFFRVNRVNETMCALMGLTSQYAQLAFESKKPSPIPQPKQTSLGKILAQRES